MKKESFFSVTIQFRGNSNEIKCDKVFVDSLYDLWHMTSCPSIVVSDEIYVSENKNPEFGVNPVN